MDQIKIGKFIAERRKLAGLTQMQLAERLDVTDRAVSKWETGKSMPDSSIMLALCKILKISVNDLLSGEVVMVDNYNEEIDSKLLELIKQKENSDRRMLTLEWVIGILSVTLLLIPTIIASVIPMEEWQRIVIIVIGLIPCIIGLFFAIKIEQTAGYYECRHCKHRHVPKFSTVLSSMHFGRTRYIKCPECKKHSWQKKVISKNPEKK